MSNCRFNNWSEEREKIINKQIQIEYWASYQYHLMWSFFDRSDIAMKNIADFFKLSSEEEREHAHKLMEYQNLRGGTVNLNGINEVNLDFLNNSDINTNNILLSFEKALEMEQKVYKSLLEVHKVGSNNEYDAHLTDFIESEYLGEQLESINKISKYVTQIKLLNNDTHGLWNFNENFKNIEQ